MDLYRDLVFCTKRIIKPVLATSFVALVIFMAKQTPSNLSKKVICTHTQVPRLDSTKDNDITYDVTAILQGYFHFRNRGVHPTKIATDYFRVRLKNNMQRIFRHMFIFKVSLPSVDDLKYPHSYPLLTGFTLRAYADITYDSYLERRYCTSQKISPVVHDLEKLQWFRGQRWRYRLLEVWVYWAVCRDRTEKDKLLFHPHNMPLSFIWAQVGYSAI